MLSDAATSVRVGISRTLLIRLSGVGWISVVATSLLLEATSLDTNLLL